MVVDPIRLLLKREAPRGPDPFPPARGSTMKFYRGGVEKDLVKELFCTFSATRNPCETTFHRAN